MSGKRQFPRKKTERPFRQWEFVLNESKESARIVDGGSTTSPSKQGKQSGGLSCPWSRDVQ